MEIKLVATHQINFAGKVPLHNCLGILQLAACLDRLNIAGVRCHVPDFSEFHHLYHRDFHEVMDAVMEKLSGPPPDVLGLSTMSNNLPIAIEICRRITGKFPGVVTILGGQGASFCAVDILKKFPFVDAVIRGEADEAFPAFIKTLAAGSDGTGIKGIVTRRGDGIVDNGWPEPIENLDALPIPAFEFCGEYNVDEDDAGADYTQVGDYNGISMEVGRGCTYECSYCSTCHYFKRQHRLKSVSRVMAELMEIRRRFGNQRIIFKHDILIFQHDYVAELCREIKRQLPGLIWKCHARFDSIDEDILIKMRDAGCNEVFLGIEAASPRMLDIMNKQLDLGAFDHIMGILNRKKFRFNLSFILGYPGETPADVEAIFAMAMHVRSLCGENVVIKIHTLVPLAGSALYEEWKTRLAYDEYGSHSTSDMPPSWRELREMIETNPAIFPLYFHVPIGKEERVRTIKYELVGWAIDSLMANSFRMAYAVLGKELAAGLVRRIDDTRLPPPSAFKDTRYHILTESIREVVMDLLPKDPSITEKYDTVARFEIAFQEVFKQKQKGGKKILEVHYDPGVLIEEIKAGRFSADVPRHEETIFYMIFWNEESAEVQCNRIPRQFAEFMR